MVYLYNNGNRMLFELPLQFHVGISFKWCFFGCFFVLCDAVSVILLLAVIV